MGKWRQRFSRDRKRAEASATKESKTTTTEPNTKGSTPSSAVTNVLTVHDGKAKPPSPPSSLPQLGVQSPSAAQPNLGDTESPSRTRSVDGSNGKKDYWQMAVQELQKEDTGIGAQLDAIQQAAVGDPYTDLATRLDTTTKEHQKALEAKRWRVVVGSKEIVVREQFDRIVKFVLLFKDVGAAAASLDPLHAGIPMAGLCLLMQMAVSDSEQYTVMLSGIDEVATVLARYQEIEKLYRSRPETKLKQEFERRLISLYKHIVRFYVMAVGYCQHKTVVRILRSFPKCDDLSPILADVQHDDMACKDIGQVFDSYDALERYGELLKRFDQLHQYMLLQQQHDNTTSSDNPVHWMVNRSPNKLFTGRDDILSDLQAAIRDNVNSHVCSSQSRIVITGMGGLGKSELCLQIAYQLQSLFWGVFWIDVSTDSLATTGLIEIAQKVGIQAQTWESARLGIANVQKPWLLVMDNADDPRIDYEKYFPTGTRGVVILTSRNAECERYATKYVSLEALSGDAARALLMDAARVSRDKWSSQAPEAAEVASLLGSHPLAIIQAGAYVSRGYCTLAEYPAAYEQQRQRLLTFHPIQAQSRYGDVYATFEASAAALRTSKTEASQDALELLSLLAMYGTNRLPLRLFKASWEGVQNLNPSSSENDRTLDLTQWHVSQLPSLIQVGSVAWDSFRLVEAMQLLKAFSLISMTHETTGISALMHPLIHAWARDRQNEVMQHSVWLQAGCVVAISCFDHHFWRSMALQEFRPHLQALVSWDAQVMFGSEMVANVTPMLYLCGRLLNSMRTDSTVLKLMQLLCTRAGLNQSEVDRAWLQLYEVMARNYHHLGMFKLSAELLEQIITIRTPILGETHPDQLMSQNDLAFAYLGNGQVKEAVTLLEKVVSISRETQEERHLSRLWLQHGLIVVYLENRQVKEAVILLEEVMRITEKTLKGIHYNQLTSQHEPAEEYLNYKQVRDALALLEKVVRVQEKTPEQKHPHQLKSQHTLAKVDLENRQVQEAVMLLEEVVGMREKTLEETHPDQLLSQHELGKAYLENGQVKEAVMLLEKVVRIRKQTLGETHPDRLASQHELARAYLENGQVKEAVTLLEKVVRIREETLEETYPDRLASQHELARAYLDTGQVKEAVTLLEEVVRIENETLDETHPDRLNSQCALADSYWDLGSHQKAHDLMSYVVGVYRRAFAEDDEDRQNAEGWLEYMDEELQKEQQA